MSEKDRTLGCSKIWGLLAATLGTLMPSRILSPGGAGFSSAFQFCLSSFASMNGSEFVLKEWVKPKRLALNALPPAGDCFVRSINVNIAEELESRH